MPKLKLKFVLNPVTQQVDQYIINDVLLIPARKYTDADIKPAVEEVRAAIDRDVYNQIKMNKMPR